MTFHVEDKQHNLASDKRGEPFVYSDRRMATIAARVLKADRGIKYWPVQK